MRQSIVARALFWIFLFACGSTAAADDLAVRAAFDGGVSVPPNEKIALYLSRALRPADGGLAVLIGDTDVTAMLTIDAAKRIERRRAGRRSGLIHTEEALGFR